MSWILKWCINSGIGQCLGLNANLNMYKNDDLSMYKNDNLSMYKNGLTLELTHDLGYVLD